jgi:hypothetical protein
MEKNQVENVNNDDEKLLLSDVSDSNWNTSDYVSQKVKRIMDYTDWKFNNYYR